MPHKVEIAYNIESNTPYLFVTMAGAERFLSIGVCNVKNMKTHWGSDRTSLKLQGYELRLNHRLSKGKHTLQSISLPKEMYEELEVFFVLFCEIEDWKNLVFTVEE